MSLSPILVVVAHPDDEVLGCGATIARVSEHRNIHILILGEGHTSRYSTRKKGNRTEVERLSIEAKASAGILGASSITLDYLPDNRFDQVPFLDIVKRVEKEVERIQPETIYTNHSGDLNIDHRITFQAVLTATRPFPNSSVRELMAFEVPSSTEWAFQQFQPSFRPNVFMDVSEYFETKLKAMAQYESEIRLFPHPRSAEALRVIAGRWGIVVGCQFAEAFELIRSVRH